ncbi:atherin-like [Motacilla alba alba]|uniref:atherin-like n=1 Tax=Motacilla alba alba TaxID=1094192 RepID=UPI0018D56DBE|nr:atherin-like [Motacilla alba alba]
MGGRKEPGPAAAARSRRWIAAGSGRGACRPRDPPDAAAPSAPPAAPARGAPPGGHGAAARAQRPLAGSSALPCGPGPAAPRGCGAPPARNAEVTAPPWAEQRPPPPAPCPSPRELALPRNERRWIAAGGRSRSGAGAGAESGLRPVRDRDPAGARSCSSRSSDTCRGIPGWKEPRGAARQTVTNFEILKKIMISQGLTEVLPTPFADALSARAPTGSSGSVLVPCWPVTSREKGTIRCQRGRPTSRLPFATPTKPSGCPCPSWSCWLLSRAS